jgi:outer membrane protein OmpA-like peptidoglycan-associated protein
MGTSIRNKWHLKAFFGLLFLITLHPAHLDAQSRNPLLVTMHNYRLNYQESGESSIGVPMASSDIVFLDGKKTFMQFSYKYNTSPGAYRVFDNYRNLVKRYGGELIFTEDNFASYKVVRANKEYWLVVETYKNGQEYTLALLERDVVQFDMSEDEFIAALNSRGSISLYVNFQSGASDLPDGADVALRRITAFLMMNPELQISIEGHTDNVGSTSDNRVLSEARARAVMGSLIRQGVSETRLSARGWGSERPIGDNSTNEGRRKNRRVELVKVQ